MNLSVFKDNENLFDVNLGLEIDNIKGASRTFFIGRSSSCQVVLNDKKVSREHAAIKYNNGVWSLEKNSDMSLLTLNGSNCEKEVLKDGDLIAIGPYTINISMLEFETIESDEEVEEGELDTSSEEELDIIEEDNLMENVSFGMDEATELMSGDELDDFDPEGVNSNDLDDFESESVESNDLDNFESEGDESNDFEQIEENVEEEFNEIEAISNEDNFLEDENNLSEDFLQDDSEESAELEDFDDFSNDLEDESQNEIKNEFSDDEVGSFEEGFDENDNEYEESFDDELNDDVDEYSVDSYDEEGKTDVLKTFANITLEIFGEFASYDKFKIEKSETFIGRDPERCDIVLEDPEVSGVHVVIKKNAIACVIEDLKSANGTILNGERINTHELTSEDEFLIGSTSFTVKIQSDFIEQEKDRIMPVEKNQVVEVEEIVEVGENFMDDGSEVGTNEFNQISLETTSQSLFSKDTFTNPEKRKKLLYIVVGLLALWVFLDDGQDVPKQAVKKKKAQVKKNEGRLKKKKERVLKPEEEEFARGQWLLAQQYFREKKYAKTIQELDKIFKLTPEYQDARQLRDLAKEKLDERTRLEEEEKKERDRIARQIKIKKLTEQARKYVEERKVEPAKKKFQEILSLDPENGDVTDLKMELDEYEKELARIEREKREKIEKRSVQENLLKKGKEYYLNKNWYEAIKELHSYLKTNFYNYPAGTTGNEYPKDEDLLKSAREMLDDAKFKLNEIANPLLSKARSLKEGQDLKGAYESYLEILQYHPSHEEALNEMDKIREVLELRSKKIYRDAIISESLSLYEDAKEKFQEVQQISPTDSSYYRKATVKLKDYLD